MRTIILLCVLPAALQVEAAPITVPPGPNPGDQYRLAFLTPSEISSGKTIGEYNSFVQSHAVVVAELNDLGATWTAIASTHDVDMKSNTGTDPNNNLGVPIFLLNGRRIASNNVDLWDGSLEGHIRVYPNGDFEPFAIEVMTRGIGPDLFNIGNQIDVGSIPTNFCAMGNCLPGEIHPPQQATGSDWISAHDQPRGAFRMYAMSSILTVVPEPSTDFNLSIGALGLWLAMSMKRLRGTHGGR